MRTERFVVTIADDEELLLPPKDDEGPDRALDDVIAGYVEEGWRLENIC